MVKKYGGVDNKISLEEMQEAKVYVKTPVHYSTPLILFKLAISAIIGALIVASVLFIVIGGATLIGNLF